MRFQYTISNNLIHINMSYFCDVCYKTIKLISKNIHLKSPTHKENDNCKHIKLTIKNPDKKEINNTDEE